LATVRAIGTETLAALAKPRRALPLAGVLAALLASEWLATETTAALALDLGLFAAFCLIAPAAWRAAADIARRRPERGRLAELAYLLFVSLVVLGAVSVPRLAGIPATYVIDPPASGLLLVLFLVGGWGLGRDIDLERGIESEQRRAERLALDAERASLLAMRAQLDPHFLFNTLNAIAEWCREDPVVAEEATLKLASMLRMILEGISLPSWPIESEIALATSLFELHEIRDRARYRFVLQLASPLPQAEVPPMIWLPLLENAITHGPSAGHAGEVVVRLRAVDSHELRLEIENPGAFRGRRDGGQGIAMVERRLALAYGGRATLSLTATGGRTLTRVTMPLLPVTAESIRR
jgi:two-component system, LytTR family, sensor histidine kinase AlgZ